MGFNVIMKNMKLSNIRISKGWIPGRLGKTFQASYLYENKFGCFDIFFKKDKSDEIDDLEFEKEFIRYVKKQIPKKIKEIEGNCKKEGKNYFERLLQ